MQNPKKLLLTSRNIEYDDYEFEVSGISHYYIVNAGELKEKQIKFKTDVADDELIFVIYFMDGSFAVASLANYNMSFIY